MNVYAVLMTLYQDKKQHQNETTLFISVNLGRVKQLWQKKLKEASEQQQSDNLDIHFQNQGQTFFPSSLIAFPFRSLALPLRVSLSLSKQFSIVIWWGYNRQQVSQDFYQHTIRYPTWKDAPCTLLVCCFYNWCTTWIEVAWGGKLMKVYRRVLACLCEQGLC